MFSKARKEMQEVTEVLTVPVVRYKDKVLVGFNPREYEEAFQNF